MQVTELQGTVVYILDVVTGQVRPLRVGDLGGGNFAPFQSLVNASFPGPGAAYSPDGFVHHIWSMQVSWTGAPTRVVVSLEVTLDGANWAEAARIDSGAGGQSGDIITVAPLGAVQARANLVTLTGTGAVTAWIGVAE